MQTSAWKPDDAAWRRERDVQWRIVQSNLERFVRRTRLKRGDLAHHQELFFDGTIKGKVPAELRVGASGFIGLLHVFWLWYHPNLSSVDLDALRSSFIEGGSLKNAARTLFREFFASGVLPPQLFPSDYGMMGGRERAVISLLCPGVDHEAVLVSSRGRKEPVCLGPSDTFRYCIDHSERELGKDARFIPHAPGQFLWPQLSFAIQHHGDRVFVDDQNSTAHAKRRRLKRLIAELLAFDERTDPSRTRESTVSMVERVQELRRSDALSDALATIWDEAAAERDALTAESAELGTFEKSMADLSAWYRDRRDQPFSEDEQRARIGAWKSV